MMRENDAKEQGETGGLSLYGYPQCPFCARVLGLIEELGIEIPLRDTMREPDHRSALIDAMGRGTVPVLRIEGDEGDTWLPESAEIIRYLIGRFASAG
jgi:glutathione S-transferase